MQSTTSFACTVTVPYPLSYWLAFAVFHVQNPYITQKLLEMSMALYPLASHQQIERTPSRDDGIPVELEEDLRAYGCKLIQQAGILLKQ